VAAEQAARRRRLQLGIRLAARGRVARLTRGERARRRLILLVVLVHVTAGDAVRCGAAFDLGAASRRRAAAWARMCRTGAGRRDAVSLRLA
jgi:hypothetical protein